MKQLRNYILLALLTLVGNAYGDELKIADFSINPEGTYDLSVELENPDYEYIMTEFWMELPDGLTIAKDEEGEFLYEESNRFDKTHSLTISKEEEGNVYHFLIYSSKNKALKGNSGTLFTLPIEAAAEAVSGTYQGRIFGQIFSDTNKQEHNPADVTFNVTLGGETPLVIESMVIVGEFPGMSWEPTEGLEMTKSADNEAVWTLTMEGVEVEGKKYEYKATANKKWGDYELPAQGNYNFVFGTEDYPAGKYNLTFTADTQNNKVDLKVEKVEEPQPTLDKLYIIGDQDGWNVSDTEQVPNLKEMVVKAGSNTFEYEVTVTKDFYFVFGDVAASDSWDDFNANHRYAIEAGEAAYEVKTADVKQLQKCNGTIVIKKTGKYMLSVDKDLKLSVIRTGDAPASGIADLNLSNYADGQWYTIQGIRIDLPKQKGLYIQKGRKFVNK